jgi:cyclophilin family peptidyl-prolyl cis-trans isomerase
MRARAVLMALAMMTTALAGCSGTDGVSEIEEGDMQGIWDLVNGTQGPEWVNDRGDSGHQWTISLSDDQWLEVASAYAVTHATHDNEGRNSTWRAIIVSDEGYVAGSGHSESKSPLFGGNYSLCIYWSDGICYEYDPDQTDHDHHIVEWSVIYRIHEVSPTNYFYTGVNDVEPEPLENITVHMEVTYNNSNTTGIITIELFPNEAPNHVDSFLTHIEGGNYDGIIFHRVIDGFMIQGGDVEGQNGYGGYAANWYGYCNGQEADGPSSCANTSWTLPDEVDNDLTHGSGTLAMAKTSAANTGGSQFYIVDDGSTPSHLDGIHTIFGQVVSGMEHVNAISEEATGSNDRPVDDVVIVTITIG